MLQHLEQRGLSLWLHQTIMVPQGWRNSPLWSPQRRAMETSFSLSLLLSSLPSSHPFCSPPPHSFRWETLNSRLEGWGARGRVKNNILYSRALTAPPGHQMSNKCGYRPIKNKGRGEKKNERATFFWHSFTALLITRNSLSSPFTPCSTHCLLYQSYLHIPSFGTEGWRMEESTWEWTDTFNTCLYTLISLDLMQEGEENLCCVSFLLSYCSIASIDIYLFVSTKISSHCKINYNFFIKQLSSDDIYK